MSCELCSALFHQQAENVVAVLLRSELAAFDLVFAETQLRRELVDLLADVAQESRMLVPRPVVAFLGAQPHEVAPAPIELRLAWHNVIATRG